MYYIKSEEEFKKFFPKKLYNKLVGDSTMKCCRSIMKEDYNNIILNLYHDLNNHEYRSDNVEELLYTYKSNNVSRILPVLSLKDEILYYFVCKMLEDEIAINRTENTFGGWRSGNRIQLEEDAEIEYVYKSYNPGLWNENWVRFQNILYSNIYDLEEKAIVLKLDIANFYDNINLNLLEKKLLIDVSSKKLEYINILMYFLKNWNLKNDKYHPKTVGIPQNEFGDQSRLLANFYLQSYDMAVKRFCDKNNAVYIRFADDQIIILKDTTKLNDIMYVISKELNKLGLNLNASKVKRYTKEEIEIFYGIPVFKLLDENKYDEAAELFFEYKDKEDVDFNYTSSLKRFLNIGLMKFNLTNRNKLKAMITEYNFVKECTKYYLKKIFSNLSKDEKEELLELIYKISSETTYNAFHYNAINFLIDIDEKEHVDAIFERITEIKNI